MATFAPVQFPRGSVAAHSTYIGPVGSLSILKDTWEVFSHDGVTPGGHKVNGLNQAAVEALISARKVVITVANGQELPAVGDAETDAFYLTEDSNSLFFLVGSAFVNLTETPEVPAKAAADAIDLGTDDVGFVTPKQLHDFVTQKLGFTRDEDGNWTADSGDVTPTP